MNDTIEFDDCLNEATPQEKDIINYLQELKLIFLTDPQQKQFKFEQAKKQLIFSFRSLDSDTDASEMTPPMLVKTSSLLLTKSPLRQKRLSIVSEHPLI
ncbi:unnamed protein product (macronuclear) [Paramecium tetraurelia]|uniref:Uncharacterized protein n=1 Tax=Paramecium tetraurelia TaxID=5888 RepID=A0E027_PARTE|nr:uncharacterized protein GSPATT00021812001 [Paramecium tetraurelia]CAK88644.1 unnamed protein product [Paramecium tetraurelia]|eukprot:XP_001456041.1 hypothetical protein (macronuclear) [Paramecium tetraurelia strain d4-2]